MPCYDWDDPGTAKWLDRLLYGVRGYRANTLSFHAYFTAGQLREDAKFFFDLGYPLHRIVFETDGASPVWPRSRTSRDTTTCAGLGGSIKKRS